MCASEAEQSDLWCPTLLFGRKQSPAGIIAEIPKTAVFWAWRLRRLRRQFQSIPATLFFLFSSWAHMKKRWTQILCAVSSFFTSVFLVTLQNPLNQVCSSHWRQDNWFIVCRLVKGRTHQEVSAKLLLLCRMRYHRHDLCADAVTGEGHGQNMGLYNAFIDLTQSPVASSRGCVLAPNKGAPRKHFHDQLIQLLSLAAIHHHSCHQEESNRKGWHRCINAASLKFEADRCAAAED